MFACAVTKAGALATSSKKHSCKKFYGDQTDNGMTITRSKTKTAPHPLTHKNKDNKHKKDNTHKKENTHTEQSKDNNTQAKRNAVGSLNVFDSHIYAPPMRGNLCASRSGPN
jgi:hypothetical protein